MFENITKLLKKFNKKEENKTSSNSTSKNAAKERLHLVLMQDRANVSADFLELMKQEIIDVIKKYIDVDESAIDVRLTNKENEDGTNGAPALYANIPIINIKNDERKIDINNGNSNSERVNENISINEEAKESKKELIVNEEKNIQEDKEEKTDNKQNKDESNKVDEKPDEKDLKAEEVGNIEEKENSEEKE